MSQDLPLHPFESRPWPTIDQRYNDPLLNPENLKVMWATQRLKFENLAKHSLTIGTEGSGKTNLLKMFMYSLLPVLSEGERRVGEHGHKPFPLRYRAILTDPKLDYVPFFHRMGFTPEDYVVITNPFDSRCSAWDLAGDLTETVRIDSFAEALAPLPPGSTGDYTKEQGNFWQIVANETFREIVNAFNDRAPGNWDLLDVVHAGTEKEWLEQILRTTHLGNGLWETYFKKDERLAANCWATVFSIAKQLATTAVRWRLAKTRFSMNKWREKGAIIVLGSSFGHPESVRAVNSLLARYAIQTCLDEPGEEIRDYSWFFLDELGTVGKFPKLLNALKGGRAKGCRIMLTDQDKASIVGAFGSEETTAIFNLCRDKAYLALSSAEECVEAAKIFGQEEQHKSSRTTQDVGGGSNTVSEELKYIIRPDQFATLRMADDHDGAFDGYFIVNGKCGKGSMEAQEVTDAMPAQKSQFKEALPLGLVESRPSPEFTPWSEDDLKRLNLSRRN